jgi:zinc transport system permease protein
MGEQLGQALIEGQLYFAGPIDLAAALLLTLASAAALPWLMPQLLRARLLPQHGTQNATRGPRTRQRWHLGFDLLGATAMAVATASIGVMAAFALVLAPAWLAFRIAPSWRWTLLLTPTIGVLGYITAFAAALLLDQPFAPVLVAVLLVFILVYAVLPSFTQHRSDKSIAPSASD